MGGYFSILIFSAGLSYTQRHDITLGNARSCCNPCIITSLYHQHKIARDERYVETVGISTEVIEDENANHLWCFEPDCRTKACDCNPVTREVVYGILTGVCLFFVFLFYVCILFRITLL